MVNLVDLPPPNPKPLNGSQFSQGTLWNPRALKPSPEHRWAAHGYSPERREAIRQAIPTVGVTKVEHIPGGGREGVFPASQQVGGKVKNLKAATRNAVVDILARSTAPVEDITRNTPMFQVKPIRRRGVAGQMKTRMDTRTGAPLRGEIMVHPGGGPQRPRAQIEHTVLHELGHHVDFEDDPRKFNTSARYDLPAVEGAAEGYAAKHRVPRRNEAPSEYSDVAAYRTMQRRPSFQHHFERMSGQPLGQAMGQRPHMGEQFDQPSLFNPHDALEYITDDDWKHLTGGR